MTELNVIITSEKGDAKDVHPLLLPDKTKLSEEEFAKKMSEWTDIDNRLKVYKVHTMRCDSGMIVSNNVLRWHIGKKYKAVRIGTDSYIQII